jgi:hypothetical protein
MLPKALLLYDMTVSHNMWNFVLCIGLAKTIHLSVYTVYIRYF